MRPLFYASCHRNGTVSYYDYARGRWQIGKRSIDPFSLMMLDHYEQARVRRHLARGGVFV